MKRIRSILLPFLPLATALPVIAQNAATDTDIGDDVYILSPFEVSTDQRGYIATNQISGTRVNMEIQRTPVALEVLTAQLLEDTGATGFKDSLQYSSGIYTESYVNSAGNPANGDRSPSSSAALGDPRANTITIRGFNAPFQQRMGFRVGTFIGIRGGAGAQTPSAGITLGALIDNVNVQRMEIVRGPGALLYGLGVISGIANILPNEPLSDQQTRVTFGIGTEDYRRVSLDNTGPLIKNDDGRSILDYRVMTAFQREGDWTDYFLDDRQYYAFQLKWYPTEAITLFTEYQYGETRLEGVGPRDLFDNNGDDPYEDEFGRAFTNPFGERYRWGHEDFAGSDPRVWDVNEWGNFPHAPDPSRAAEFTPASGPFLGHTARVAGPDTWYERQEWSALARLQWHLAEGLDLTLGGFYSEQDIEELKVFPFMINSAFGVSSRFPIDQDHRTTIPVLPSDQVFGIINPTFQTGGGDVDDVIYRAVGHFWSLEPAKASSAQFQADLRYAFTTPFFGGDANHSFLIGRQDISDEADVPVGAWTATSTLLEDEDITTVRSFYSWNDPIRYNGEDFIVPGTDYYSTKLWYSGTYLVYNGTFFDDKLGIIAGLRQDRFQAWEDRWLRDNESGAANVRIGSMVDSPYYNFEKAIKVTTNSVGITYALLDNKVNLYAVFAGGVIPNTGLRDGDGLPIAPEETSSKEIGVKFNLANGKVSGTVSAFQIDRENAIWSYANAPAPGLWKEGRNPFRSGTTLDVERLKDGDDVRGYAVSYDLYFREIIDRGEAKHAYANHEPTPAEIEQARELRTRLGYTENPRQPGRYNHAAANMGPGILDVVQARSAERPVEEITEDFQPYVYINYETLDQYPELRAIMEEAFADFSSGDHPDSIVPMKYAINAPIAGRPGVGNASARVGGNVTFEERSEGFDGQMIFSPLPEDNLQIIFSFSYITREATSDFQLAQAQDYRFEDFGPIGTEYDIWVKDFGRDAFEDPRDPTTLKAGIKGKSLYYGSEYDFRVWGRYTFIEGPLEDFGFGIGLRYQGPAQTSIPLGGSDLAENRYMTPDTEPLLLLDAALYYERDIGDIGMRISLNLYNLLDNHLLYSETSYPNYDYPDELTEVRRSRAYVDPFRARLTVSLTF